MNMEFFSIFLLSMSVFPLFSAAAPQGFLGNPLKALVPKQLEELGSPTKVLQQAAKATDQIKSGASKVKDAAANVSPTHDLQSLESSLTQPFGQTWEAINQLASPMKAALGNIQFDSLQQIILNNVKEFQQMFTERLIRTFTKYSRMPQEFFQAMMLELSKSTISKELKTARDSADQYFNSVITSRQIISKAFQEAFEKAVLKEATEVNPEAAFQPLNHSDFSSTLLDLLFGRESAKKELEIELHQ